MILKARMPQTPTQQQQTIRKDNKLLLDHEFNHAGEVNKARVMPQSHNLVATKTVSGDVHVFDVFKQTTRPVDKTVRPTLVLTGHQREGYGLAWNQAREGVLLSGSDDGVICLWDIN